MDKIDVCNIENYDYYLPEELIAQSPSLKRDHSRLMVLNKDTKNKRITQAFIKTQRNNRLFL